jgi:hypothetical protein
MKRRNLAFAVVLLATVGSSMALMPPGARTAANSSSSSAASQAASGASANPEQGTSAYSTTEILKQYLYGQDLKAPRGQEKEALDKLIRDPADPRFKYSVDSIIATLPDPIETGLSVKLDDEIDAIQRAAESEGYVLDRFKLPWPTPSERAAKGDAAEIDQSEDIEPPPDETPGPGKPARRTEPGILLFRDGHAHHLLAVFLVGETPTSGIHKPALRKALEQACELHNSFASSLPRGECRGNCPPINIMGPAFSGSQDSTVFAIHDWRSQGSLGSGNTSCRDVPVRMISGSATSIDQRLFQGPDNVDFKATVIPDSTALLELSQWIKDRGMGSDTGEGVAILSESNTGYGGGVRAALSQSTTSRLSAFSAALSLKFPIHISELQKAREGATAQASAAAQSLALALKNSNIPLATAAGRERRDIIPIYSDSEVNSIELVLDQLLESIKQQRVGCVIIAASNVEDTIFLAREVRATSPNAMLISLNASVLFLHSAVNPDLHGVFVASQYPLFSANQVWTNPFWGAQRRIQFPSDNAEGAYNATVALLGGDRDMLDYGDPFDANARVPPLWITMIGSGGVWPLATIPVKDDGHYLYQRASWATSNFPSYVWPGWPAAERLELLQLAILIVTLLLCAMWTIATLKPEMLPASVEQFFAGSTFDEWRVERRIYQALILLLLIAELAIVMHYVSFKRFQGLDVASPADTAAALLVYRASSLGSRVSPLTPILFALAAGLALCMGGLRRTRLRETRQVQTPFLDFETPSFSGVADLEARVRHALAHIAVNSPVLWIAILAMVSIYASLYWWSGSWPIDGPSFARLFFVLSILAYLGIAYADYKLIAVWLSTRRLLRRLYWHPSRSGYEKFRGEIPEGQDDGGVDLISSAPSLTALEIGLAQVRRMIAAATGSAPDDGRDLAARIVAARESLSGRLNRAEQKLAAVMAAYGQLRWRDEIRLKRDTEEEMSALSKAVAQVYESSWRTETPAAQESKAKDAGPPSALDCGEIYVASRVVDWLRQVMPQLQGFAFSATVAMLLMLFAISSYPFPMSDRLLWFSWAVVVVTVGAMVWMFVSANRDRVMSLIAGTTPGRTEWNASLIVNLVTHALLPLVVLLGAAFPERLSRLASWIGGVFGGAGG